MQFVQLIKNASDAGLAKHFLFRSLGTNLVLSPPPKDDQLSIMNEVWIVIMKLEDTAAYMACADVWVEYPVKYFGRREVC